MNQVFDFSRFRLLVAAHWVENRQKYLLSLGAIAGLLLLWFVFLFIMERGQNAAPVEVQSATYFTVLIFTGCLFASTIFNPLSSKSRGINYLSLPASHLEKMLVAILYAVVLFFVCYTLIFYIVDYITLQIFNPIAKSNFHPYDPDNQFAPRPLANVFTTGDSSDPRSRTLFILLLAYFAVQAAFLAGSVFFIRFSFIKTFIVLLVAGFFYWLIIYMMAKMMLPNGFYTESMTEFGVNRDGVTKILKMPGWMTYGSKFLLMYMFAPLFWLAAYHRLKEKEI